MTGKPSQFYLLRPYYPINLVILEILTTLSRYPTPPTRVQLRTGASVPPPVCLFVRYYLTEGPIVRDFF